MAASPQVKSPGLFATRTDLSGTPTTPRLRLGRMDPYVSTPVPRGGSRKSTMLSQSFTFGVAQNRTPIDFIRGIDRATSGASDGLMESHGETDLNATYPAPSRRQNRGKGRFRGVRGLHMLEGKGIDTFNFSPMPPPSPSPFGSGNYGGGANGFKTPLSSAKRGGAGGESDTSLLRSLLTTPAGNGPTNAESLRNPNKALVTVAPDGRVLIANQVACSLFGYGSSAIVGENLSRLLRKDAAKEALIIEDLLVDNDGAIEQINGRVMLGIHATGEEFPISLWMRRVQSATPGDVRYVTVVEPVVRVELKAALDAAGRIMWGDESFLQRFGFAIDDVLDRPLVDLIPGAKLDSIATGQHVTCHGNEMQPTPCTLTLSAATVETAESIAMSQPSLTERAGNVETSATLHIYTTLSGLISINNDGSIYGCNENFVLLLLGYTESQMLNMDVVEILPDIFDEMTSFPPQLDFGDALGANTSVASAGSANISGASGSGADGSNGSPSKGPGQAPRHFFEGSYSGKAVHADGSELFVWYQVRTVQTEDGQNMHCIWLTGDNQPDQGLDQSYGQSPTQSTPHGRTSPSSDGAATAANESSLSTHGDDGRIDEILYEGNDAGVGNHSSRGRSISTSSDISREDMGTEYGAGGDGSVAVHPEDGLDHAYFTQDELGRGSFGFVKKCTQIETGDPFVVKFIMKSKILSESWDPTDASIIALPDDNGIKPGMTPREVHLLLKLDHPNVIKATALYQNAEYYHLILESHDVNGGTAFDLFEFIDTNPNVDEQIASYVFRQVIDAVAYLHENSVLHRDIKDENVILNEHLDAKLIDFGSAAYMEPNKLFDTFCGTIEYCAPEVLEGNPYPGPELEVFSLGVTLYTLLFGENPFMDVEETIRGGISITRDVSPLCTDLVMHILEPNPLARITVLQLQEDPWLRMDVRAVVAAALQAEASERTSGLGGRRLSEAASDTSDLFEYGQGGTSHLDSSSNISMQHPLDSLHGRPESAGNVPLIDSSVMSNMGGVGGGDDSIMSGGNPMSPVSNSTLSPISNCSGSNSNSNSRDASLMSTPGGVAHAGRSSVTAAISPHSENGMAKLMAMLAADKDLGFFCKVMEEQEMEFEEVASLTAVDLADLEISNEDVQKRLLLAISDLAQEFNTKDPPKISQRLLELRTGSPPVLRLPVE